MTVSRATVLIVEDNLMNMELATELLLQGGYAVSQAHSAEEGLRLAQDELPALILMDLRLPGMDGYAALGQLRRDARTAHIRVVALTAQAMKGDEQTALEAGFNGYISKPIDTRTFCQTVARLLAAEEGK